MLEYEKIKYTLPFNRLGPIQINEYCTIIQQGCIKLIKSDKDIHKTTKDFHFL